MVRDVGFYNDHDGFRPRWDFAKANSIFRFFIGMVSFRVAFFFAATRFRTRTRFAIFPIPGASATATATLGSRFIALCIVAIVRHFIAFYFRFIQIGLERKIVVVPMVGIDQVIIDPKTKSRGLALTVACSSAAGGGPLGFAGTRSAALIGLAAFAFSLRSTATVLFAIFRTIFVSRSRCRSSATPFGFVRNCRPSVANFATSSTGPTIVRAFAGTGFTGTGFTGT